MGTDIADRRDAEAEQVAQGPADEVGLDAGPDRLGALGRGGPAAGVTEHRDVDVCVDETGQHGVARDVDDPRAVGDAVARRHERLDPAIPDQDRAGVARGALAAGMAAPRVDQPTADECQQARLRRDVIEERGQPIGLHPGIVAAGQGGTLPGDERIVRQAGVERLARHHLEQERLSRPFQHQRRWKGRGSDACRSAATGR